VITHHRFGRGEVIYSAADIEALEAPSAVRLWLALITKLAGRPWILDVRSHPCVWCGAFHQTDRRRVLLLFANYSPLSPALPVPSVAFTLQPVASPYLRLVELPSGYETPASRTAAGAIAGGFSNLDGLRALAAEY
jgi:hypothetical protein